MRQTSGSVIRKIATAMLSVLDAVLFSAHKALVTSQMHIASVQEAHQALTKKNQELEEMNEQIKAFERLKSSFLSTVSHELRTPLTSIIGYSDMLSEGMAGSLDEDQRQFIRTIKTKGEELLKLISAILDFSQIETGHLNLRKRETDPKKLLDEVIEETEETAERRGVKLVTDLAGDLRPVELDSERIQAAVGHLVDNAIKFSPPGGVVKVSARVTPSEHDAEDEDDGVGFVLMTAPDWLDITIEDFGEGIDEENHELIFAPFTQLDDSTTREHGGAGLGLAVVKHFVEAHGGRVSVQSTPAKGSTFTIRLPIMPME
jgi:signal transduction histidine kinase